MPKKRAIVLLSDGLDSPVATFLLEQSGLEVIGLHFDNRPFVAPVKKTAQRKEKQATIRPIFSIAQTLENSFRQQKAFNLFIMPQGEDLGRIIRDSNEPNLTCVLCKRLMLKKAAKVAFERKAQFIALGDILGEQASQTIENLETIEEALTGFRLIRPNIGLNKQEVVAIAREIGTEKFSAQGAQYTCTAVPDKPSTKADLETILQVEKQLAIDEWVSASWEQAEIYEFSKSN